MLAPGTPVPEFVGHAHALGWPLSMRESAGDRWDVARTLTGLADGRPAAVMSWNGVLARFGSLGDAEVDEVRARLHDASSTVGAHQPVSRWRRSRARLSASQSR
jgi:hypothetical protein